MYIFIVGPQGSGKSHLARLLKSLWKFLGVKAVFSTTPRKHEASIEDGFMPAYAFKVLQETTWSELDTEWSE